MLKFFLPSEVSPCQVCSATHCPEKIIVLFIPAQILFSPWFSLFAQVVKSDKKVPLTKDGFFL